MWMAVDENSYTYHMDIYTGKKGNNDQSEIGVGKLDFTIRFN